MAGIKIDIDIESKEARQSIKNLEQNFSKLFRSVDKESKQALTTFDVFKGALASQVAFAALRRLQQAASSLFRTFITDGIRAASEQEDAINKLNTALKTSGRFTQAASDELVAYAESLQATTKFGDEAIIGASALIQTLGQLDKEGLKKATAAALDLSAALGTDLQSAALLVGKAAAGDIGTLSRYGVTVKRGADNAETFARVLTELNTKFGGAAAAQLKTYSGATAQLGNTFGDLQEITGGFVTNNPVLIASFNQLNGIIKQLQGVLLANQDAINNFISRGIIALAEGINAVARGIAQSIVFFEQNQRALESLAIAIGATVVGFKAYAVVSAFAASGVSILTVATNALKLALQGLGIGLLIAGIYALVDAYRIAEERNITFVQALKVTAGNIIGFLLPALEVAISAFGSLAGLLDKEYKESSDRLIENLRKQQKELSNTGLTAEQVAAKEVQVTQAKSIELINIAELESAQKVKVKQEEANKIKAIDKELSDELAARAAAKKELDAEEADLALAQEQLESQEKLQRIADVLGTEETLREQAEINRLNRQKKFLEAGRKQRDLNEKAEKESIFRIQKFEEISQKQRLQNLQSTLGTIATLQQNSTGTLFAIGKAAALATATIDGYKAVQTALGSAPPPFNFALAALVGVATAANIAKIAAVKPPSKGAFQDGGIVPGNSFAGDNVPIRANSGELILNRRQQQNLFEQINRGDLGGGGLSINIQGDILGDDGVIDRLVGRINDAVEFRNVRLRTS